MENFNHAWAGMERIIRSWGFNQEEYREKLSWLVPTFLLSLLACIEKHMEEMEWEAMGEDGYKASKIREWIEYCRGVQKMLEVLKTQGVLDGNQYFRFNVRDCALFDRNENFEIGNLIIFSNRSLPEGILNPFIIPAALVHQVSHDGGLSDQESDILKLAVHKSEVARCEQVDPRKYWPVLESRRRE